MGHEHQLRARPANAPRSAGHGDPLIVLALDGVPRRLLYELVRQHELPNLEVLLGDDPYLDDSLLSTLPSTTMPAWVTAMTGVGPAEHGVAGNEYFVRETRQFACPAPVSFKDPDPTLSIYTDRYLDRLVEVPTVYERMRAASPNILIWVGMNHLFRGADQLLLAKQAVIAKALLAIVDVPANKSSRARKLYKAMDESAIDALATELGKTKDTPDVLTVYVSGTDLYAHVAPEGPIAAERGYLRDVVDPQLGKLVERLRDRGMLDRAWTMVIADHGHTAVVHDKRHALGATDGPPAVLRAAGFRVRPFKQDVPAADPFSAVLAYGGAMAYVYLADRSQCGAKDACPWQLPPRYDRDVLPAAEAFYRANVDGTAAPQLEGTLDLILTRRPRPYAKVDLPFEVYVGGGKTVPLEDYLREHPHPSYVAFPERLRMLAVGVHGERAGDILLIAHSGDREDRGSRYYFAHEYQSWHGSPSRDDSEIPLIVSHHGAPADRIGAWVKSVLGAQPYQNKIADLMLGIRSGALDKVSSRGTPRTP